MAVKKTGLGKGLESVFLDNAAPSGGGTNLMKISDVQPRKNQPRKRFDSEGLQALADSIANHGLLQPVAVRESPGGYYEIIAGERRWRAAKMAGLSEIPVVVVSADDRKTEELSLIENLLREDLNPIEVASAYSRLREEYGLTQEDIARSVGKSRSAIANSLRLLDLPEACKALLRSGQLSEGHAKVLLGVDDPEKLANAAKVVVERELSVRETEALVKKINKLENDVTDEPIVDDTPVRVNYTKVLEEKAARLLGRRVAISGRGKTKRLELYYENREDLEAILETLCGKQLYEDDV